MTDRESAETNARRLLATGRVSVTTASPGRQGCHTDTRAVHMHAVQRRSLRCLASLSRSSS
jgi:hypothetical protein